MAPSAPRGLRGWLGAMFGHGGAAVPIIRPLEIQKTNGIRSRVGSEWAKGPFGPHFVGLVRSLEPLDQPFQRYVPPGWYSRCSAPAYNLGQVEKIPPKKCTQKAHFEVTSTASLTP